jgi:putative ABC transport system substrate-binding protein
MSALILNVSSENDFEAAFAALAQQRADALLITGDAFFTGHVDRLATLTTRQGIAAVHGLREFAAAGGLMSYGASITEAYRQAGVYAGKILKGTKPADLPIMQPTRFELVLNLKTAKTLSLDVPWFLQQRADEVIE